MYTRAVATTIPAPPPTRVSDEEYLRRERDPNEELRSELLHGEVTMMPGGTLLHGNLPLVLAALTYEEVRSVECAYFSSDVKVRVPGAGYLYSDLSFACDPKMEGRDILLNPISVVEVLSSSTERRDRTAKFDAYGLVSSLQEIVLVAPEERRVEVYRRDGDEWRLRIARAGEVARLLVGEAEVPVDRLYADFDRLTTSENSETS